MQPDSALSQAFMLEEEDLQTMTPVAKRLKTVENIMAADESEAAKKSVSNAELLSTLQRNHTAATSIHLGGLHLTGVAHTILLEQIVLMREEVGLLFDLVNGLIDDKKAEKKHPTAHLITAGDTQNSPPPPIELLLDWAKEVSPSL